MRDYSRGEAGANAIHDRLSRWPSNWKGCPGASRTTAAGRYYEGQRPPSKDRAALEAVLARIEANERHTIGAFQTVHERLEGLGKQFAQTQEAGNARRKIRPPSRRSRQRCATSSIISKSANAARAKPCIRCRTRISEAEKARTTGSGTPSDPDALAKLDSEVARLAERIEELRQSSETLTERAQAAAAGAARSELREVENRIEQLLSQAQVAMRQTASASGDLTKVWSEVEGLAQRLDDIKIEAASERDVHALRLAIEELSNRIAQGRDAKPLEEFDRRLGELAHRLDQSPAQTAVMPQLQDLEARLQGLDQRLAEAARRKPDSQAMGMLERQMEGLSERLMATEQRLAGIATIERFDEPALPEPGTDPQHGAERRGRNRDPGGRTPVRPTARDEGTGASPELVALEEALGAVQREVQQSDRQTQETLQAVHETLEQIVDKLAELEAVQAVQSQTLHRGSTAETETDSSCTLLPRRHRRNLRRLQTAAATADAQPLEQVLQSVQFTRSPQSMEEPPKRRFRCAKPAAARRLYRGGESGNPGGRRTPLPRRIPARAT